VLKNRPSEPPSPKNKWGLNRLVETLSLANRLVQSRQEPSVSLSPTSRLESNTREPNVSLNLTSKLELSKQGPNESPSLKNRPEPSRFARALDRLRWSAPNTFSLEPSSAGQNRENRFEPSPPKLKK